MRKRSPKKLMLAKETLNNLESGSLGHIAGAATASCTGCGAPACPWSGFRTCVTCGQTCGTNLC